MAQKMKSWKKIGVIILGVLVLLLMVANFGLNFWLKSELPKYIKNNSNYQVSYKSLAVEISTGRIFATGISVNTKNPQNQNVIGLQGTIDTVSISRLGIYDAIFNKRINTSNLVLKQPHLNIILAKPVDQKTGKKRNPIVLENINIQNGNINIFKHTKQKFVGVNNLNLTVENLQMTEKSVEEKLPVVFDKYDIKGENFYFRPDNVYAFTAKKISTKDNQMDIQQFAMHPLLNYQQFVKFYPKKRNLFDVKATEMNFKDIILKNNKISLTNVKFDNPKIKMYTTNVKPKEKKKSFTYDVNLEDVLFNNAKIEILKPTGNPLFTAGNLNMNISKLLMNDETAKGNVPFEYEKFDIKGQNINYVSATEDIKILALAATPKGIDIRNVLMKPTVSASDKTLLDLSAQRINLNINDWNFRENKLKLDVQQVLVDQLNGSIIASKNAKKKKANFSGINFPLQVKTVFLKNSNLVYEKGNQPLVFKDLNANIQDIEMNENTIKDGLPFKTGNYSLTTRNFNYKTKFYNLSATLLKLNKNQLNISNFAMKPSVSRSQFVKMIPTEKDLYDLKVNQITALGNWDLVSTSKFLNASNVTLQGANANIFRSKIPKDDMTEKLLYSRLLRTIKFPMIVQNLDIKNSILEYEEDTKKSDGPGKLTFTNFNLNAKNLNSNKSPGKPTLVPIAITCKFMNASPMNVKWSFDTANMNDAFAISGNIADLPASRINPFIEPYLKIRATGLISDLIFNFKGNYKGINGSLKMVHQKLRISVLKEGGEKNKFLSAVANLVVRSDSKKFPESVTVDHVERDKTKSFFNLFWKGIELGLKKTLIGKNIEKTEKKVKNTVETTKNAVNQAGKDFKAAKKEVKTAVQNTKQNIKDKKENLKNSDGEKKGFFRRVFNKKPEE